MNVAALFVASGGLIAMVLPFVIVRQSVREPQRFC